MVKRRVKKWCSPKAGGPLVPVLNVNKQLGGVKLPAKPQMAACTHWRAQGGDILSLNEHFQHPHCFMTLMRTVHSDYLISKVEETLKHYLSPLLKTFPRSLFVVNIIKSHLERPFFTIPTRAVLQSLVRSSDKNSDGAMDLEEFESFGDFNLVYTHWPQQIEMAKSSLWGMKRLVVASLLASILFFTCFFTCVVARCVK